MLVRLLRPLYAGGSAHDTGATVEMPDELAEAYCARGMVERVEPDSGPAPRKKHRAPSMVMRRKRR